MERTVIGGGRLFKWVGGAFAVAVVLVAMVVSALRIVVPQVPQYRGEVAAWAGRLLGAPVDIADMDLQWRRLRPELVFGDVRYVSADARHAFAARELRVGISVRLLFHGRVVPAGIVLVEPDLTLDFQAVGEGDGAGWRRAFADRDHRGDVRIERGRVTLLANEGRRRIDFESVNLDLSSDGHYHRLRIDAQPAAGVGGALDADLSARSWPGRRDWQADGRVELRGLDLVALQRVGRRGRLESGRMDIAVDVSVSPGGAQQVAVDLGLAALRWADTDGEVHAIDRAAGEAVWMRRNGDWDAMLRRLVVARATGVRESGPVTVARSSADDTARWRLVAGALYIDDLAGIAEALPWEPMSGLDEWLARSPRGRVATAELTFQVAPDTPARYAFAVRGDRFGLDPLAGSRWPGFEAVALDAAADDASGRASIAITDGTVSMPRVFRDGHPVFAGEAELAWRNGDDGWEVVASRIAIENADVRTHGNGRMFLPHAGGERTLDLSMAFNDVSLAAHGRYLPVVVMSDNLVGWLDRAVVGGQAPAGTFRYAGPMSGAALRDGRAALDAAFVADGVALDFADHWPTFEDGRVEVRFSATGFSASVAGGTLEGVPVENAEVAIDAFRMPVLTIDAASAGPLGPMLDAFRSTPVGGAAWLAGASADGNARLDLKVSLPLESQASADVDGTLAFDESTLAFGGFPHPLTAVNGRLAIAADGVDAERVQGDLLGAPVVAQVATLRDGNGAARAVELTLDGRADSATLAALLEHPAPPVSGNTDWQARLLAPYDEGHAPYLEISSTLAGLGVDLPQPLGKEPVAARPIAIRMELLEHARPFSVDAGSALQARGAFVSTPGRWRLANGHILVGNGELPSPPYTGVTLSGRFESWRQGFGDVVPALGGGIAVDAVDLHIDSLDAYDRMLGAIHLRGSRVDDGWQWRVDGERLAGSVHIPDEPTNDAPITVDFARALLPPRAQGDDVQRAGDLDARTVPPVIFQVDDFSVGAVSLGELNGAVRRVENGVALEGFAATRDNMRITGDASWHTVDGFHRTTLRTTVDTTDARRALAALGYAASVEASAGHLQADVDWLGSPFAPPLEMLNGTVRVRIERGTLYELQPGAGRVFGLLSLNALPRRLALDFSDVFRRGLAFDSIAGSFRIEQGDAYTDDLRLVGPAARVDIKGRTGLARRDYEQEAVVVASFASSLAIAGTLAGGPGVGAAMLIASELLKGPLEGMSRVRYRVTGPWDQPLVERIESGRDAP